MAADSLPTRNTDQSKYPEPSPTTSATDLSGTPLAVDELRGRLMDRKQEMVDREPQTIQKERSITEHEPIGTERPLHEIAERVGGAVGSAVKRVRSELQLVKGHARQQSAAATQSASEVAQSVAEKISDIRETATQTASQLKETTGQRLSEWNDLAQQRIIEARRRTARMTNEYPIQTILGFAAVSFAIGFALRIWRSNRD